MDINTLTLQAATGPKRKPRSRRWLLRAKPYTRLQGTRLSSGYLVLFGQSSGAVTPFPPSALNTGSLYLTRPGLADYTATRSDLEMRANAVLRSVQFGELRVKIFKTLPLSESVEAHRLLESRKTQGKLILVP
jgi:NADPH:quinone reductase-like Zn-dependent oxidoreductase